MAPFRNLWERGGNKGLLVVSYQRLAQESGGLREEGEP